MEAFLHERHVRFYGLQPVAWVDKSSDLKLTRKFSDPPDIKRVLSQSLLVSACDSLFRNPENFVPGSLHFCTEYWGEILKGHPDKEEMLLWIREGVRLEPFLNQYTCERFEGKWVHGKIPPKYHQKNNVPHCFNKWVTEELSKWEKSGVIIRETDKLRAKVVLPLTIEPTKPRLIHDARYINLFCRDKPFKMEGAGKIPQVGWMGMFMFSVDHKSGYHHVALHHSAWEYFGMEWQGVVYMATTLTFGAQFAPYCYHKLTDATIQYVRVLTLAPSIAWLDDIWGANAANTRGLSNLEQWQSANRVLFVLCMVLYLAGYFLNLEKSVLRPTLLIRFLGIMADSQKGNFFVPVDRVQNLVGIVQRILSKDRVSFKELERCVGKCRSMAIAVPCAILYTREQYAALKRQVGGKSTACVEIKLTKGLREELSMWLELGAKSSLVNGAKWLRAEHCIVQSGGTGFTDASGRRWGGFIQTKEGRFEAAADFEDGMLPYHIGQKEALGLRNVLMGFILSAKQDLRGKMFTIHIDNQGLFDILERGGSTNDLFTTSICKELFWAQVSLECHFKYIWTPTHLNQADAMTRENLDNDVRLVRRAFLKVWRTYGPFDTDLMASPANVQEDLQGNKLPFYSQYFTEQAWATDVFSVDICVRPGYPKGSKRAANYCFPPMGTIGLLVEHTRNCKAKCVIIAPEMNANWLPAIMAGCISKMTVAEPGEEDVFLRYEKGEMKGFKSRYKIIAYLVRFD